MNKQKMINIHSLSIRLPMLFALSFIMTIVIVLVCVFLQFQNQTLGTYARMADGLTNLMMEPLDPDKIDYYIENNFESEEYNDIVKYYYSLKDNYMDVQYMYVYRFFDGEAPYATVVIDLDEEYTETPPQESIDWIGETYEVDDPFASNIQEMVTDKKVMYHDTHTQEDGWLFSYVKPVTNSKGEYVCSVCVDFSMTHMYEQDYRFLLSLLVLLLIVQIVIFVIDYTVVSREITVPLAKISKTTSRFSYETEESRIQNVQMMENLNLNIHGEIGDIYHVFLSVLKDSYYYMSNLEKAKKDIQKQEAVINYMGKAMYKDALTGVGNKAAYAEELKKANERISGGYRKYSVMMVDINNLKYVNDTFGHEKGDFYINGCCDILKEICPESPIYRIGGDEFVVVLSDRAHQLANQLFAKLMIAFNTSFTAQGREPWEKYSASVGMASFQREDTVLENTFKRADGQMYANKEQFKKRYGSYR